MKTLITIFIAVCPLFAPAQTADNKTGSPATIDAKTKPTISISANGTDVRSVIHDLFTQAKQSYVLQPGIQFVLYLALDKVDFEEALNIVCNQATLQFEIQNGIYYVSKAKPAVVAAAMPRIPKGTLDKSVLDHKFSVKFAKAEIRTVFGEIGKQAKVNLEVDKGVPAYKLDLRFDNVTLRHALEKITKAAALAYKFTDHLTILIYKPGDPEGLNISGR